VSREPQNQQEGKDNLLCEESISKEKNERTKAHLSLEVSSISDFTMIRKQWPGETWLLPSRSTLSLFAESELVLGKINLIEITFFLNNFSSCRRFGDKFEQ
jgi:hypothetical protein